MADRILGSQFLEDIAEFFMLFQTMYDGFVERAQAVDRTLLATSARRSWWCRRSRRRRCARPSSSSTRSASAKLHLGALVLNKVLPGWFLRPAAATGAAERLCARRRDRWPAAGAGPGGRPTRASVARVLGEVGESFLNFQVVAREAERGRAARRRWRIVTSRGS